MENGKWKVESGKWKVENGKWKVESGKWKVESGKWKVESGNWKVEMWKTGKWKLESGNWKVENGKWKLEEANFRSVALHQFSNFNSQISIFNFLFSLLIFQLLIIGPVHSQVITLDSVLHLIDAQNPMLQEYDIRVNALNTYSQGAKSWMAPMVGAGTFMTPYPNQHNGARK